MNTPSPALVDALDLLSDNLYLHLDGAYVLATDTDWSSVDKNTACKVINDLVLIIRGLLLEHRIQTGAECQICASASPCPVVTTIHSFLKDPSRQFIALVERARDDG